MEQIIRAACFRAREHGINVESTKITLEKLGERSVAFRIEVLATKLFFSAVVAIHGRAELNENLEAFVEGVSCSGVGMIGSIACGVIRPYIESVNGKKFPLMNRLNGALSVSDLTIETGDPLQIHARFSALI